MTPAKGGGRRPRLRLQPGNGLVAGARQLPSPNCDDRPAGVAPELIVVHGISLPPGTFGGPYIDHLFTNALDPFAHDYFRDVAGLKVSSHLLIRRTGEVVQYVPIHRRAWHAGKSSFRGRSQCNDFSVGIELEGTDHEPYTSAQYRRLAVLIRALRRGVPSLAAAPVVGHSDIAPGRKTDPGPAFDWRRLRQLMGAKPLD
ncbi:MAG: 1,6-anhydro-N-acetylmuramyl-L-alanine amidase AmpD [Gammaproteobacteria bacterium]|nr:1,6-anhydro-N-acetylmuramyl-L-alanine amidase AmpD [Gammaproteobacteria bacterium]